MELEKRNKIIDEALKEHYRETMERKRVPSDYLLMYTEGGEADAVADAIEKSTLKEVGNFAIPAKLTICLEKGDSVIAKEDFEALEQGKSLRPKWEIEKR